MEPVYVLYLKKKKKWVGTLRLEEYNLAFNRIINKIETILSGIHEDE